MKKTVIKKLKPGMIVAEPIITKKGQLIAKKGSALTSPLIARLSFYKIEHVIVEDFDESAEDVSVAAASSNQGTLAADNTASNEKIQTGETANSSYEPHAFHPGPIIQSPKFQKFEISYSRNMAVLKSNFDSIIADKQDVSYEVLVDEAEDLFKSKTSIELFDLIHNMRGIDDSIYAHSLNVALISRAMGKWLKLSRSDLDILTVAGLLHDIGKTQIPENMLNKPGKYTPQELTQVQQHPLLGYRLLKSKNFDERIKLAALQHHERCDGSGYPRGLNGEEISDFACIIAIADVYDAMTAARSYHVPKCPFQVIAAFERDGLQKYNTKYILTFLERIANTYQNSRVMLNDAQRAQIIYINKGILSRPIVKTDNGVIIDLSRERDLFIQSIL